MSKAKHPYSSDRAVNPTRVAADATELAIERTAMAANRTLMAWVRTALSLISFGFTIYKFLESTAGKAQIATMPLIRSDGPRRLGLTLIGLGTASAIVGGIEYFESVRWLNRQSLTPRNPLNFSFAMGVLIGLLGLFLFITIIINEEVF